jgi:hypothetical protein
MFNQTRVVKQYRFAVVGDEWQTDIGPPKAITADIHPIATRRSELGVDPGAFALSLCNNPILPFAARRALGLGQRSLRFDAVVNSGVKFIKHPRFDVTDENCLGRLSVPSRRGARLRGAPAPSGMRSSAVASQDDQPGLVIVGSMDAGRCAAKFEGRHVARAGAAYFLLSITTARSAQSLNTGARPWPCILLWVA